MNKKQPSITSALILITLVMVIFTIGLNTGTKGSMEKVSGEMVGVTGMAACFLPSTLITPSDGNKKQIQFIKPGDKVLSYDLKNKKPVISTVTNTFSHLENEYLIVNDKIKVTPYHNMYINGEWKQIGNAKVGDYLMDKDGNKILIESIEQAYDKEGVMVYDLEIAEHHYYFAEDVLVHNSISYEVGQQLGTDETGSAHALTVTDVGDGEVIAKDENGVIYTFKVTEDGQLELVSNTVDVQSSGWSTESTTTTTSTGTTTTSATTLPSGPSVYDPLTNTRAYKDGSVWSVASGSATQGTRVSGSTATFYSYQANENPSTFSVIDKNGVIIYYSNTGGNTFETSKSNDEGIFFEIPGQTVKCPTGGCQFNLQPGGRFEGVVSQGQTVGGDRWTTFTPNSDGGFNQHWSDGFFDTKYYVTDSNGYYTTAFDRRTPDGKGGFYYIDCIAMCQNMEIEGEGSMHISADGTLTQEGPPWGLWFGNLLADMADATSGYSGVSFFYDESDPVIELDETMSNLLGGIDGWTSIICKTDVVDSAEDMGMAISPFADGAYAHIEGEKIQLTNFNVSPEVYPEGKTTYLYKISLVVSSGSETRGCDIDFKVELDGTSLFTKDGSAQVFKTKRDDEDKNTVSYAGPSMLALEYENNYNKLCIHFEKDGINPELVTGSTRCLIGVDDDSDLCTTIRDGGARRMETEDPCDLSDWLSFTPICWSGDGLPGGQEPWTQGGEGTGGTLTPGDPASEDGEVILNPGIS